MDTLNIAVVIPAYRAAAHICSVIAGIPPWVRHIIVVDDCCPDGTAARVEERRDPRVRLLRHEQNQGVGGAVLTGYRAALELGAEIIVKMDSDGQMDPAQLPALVKPILDREADYAKGNRFIHLRQLRSMPLLRRIGNAGLSFLTKLASGYWNIFDPNNGYTAIHAGTARLLNTEAISRRYFFESSMLVELSLLRAVVRDVPIPARYGDEVSSLSEWDALISFPPKLLKAFSARIFLQYFLRDFTACSVFILGGLLLTLFGAGWGGWHWYQSVAERSLASSGTVMIAVLPLILGIQLLLQAVQADIQNVPTQPIARDLTLDLGTSAVRSHTLPSSSGEGEIVELAAAEPRTRRTR